MERRNAVGAALLSFGYLLVLSACGNGGSLLARPEISVDPQPRAIGVVVTKVIKATFREPMDALTITSTSFTLIDETRTPVQGSVSYDAATNTAAFTPQNDLAPDTLYTATLGSEIRTVSGEPLTEFVWSFRTTPVIFRVSLNADGEEGTGASSGASVGIDGRFVGFVSDAFNLVSDDGNGVSDMFVKDVQGGSVDLVSRGVGGDPGSGPTTAGEVSDDGQYAVFGSEAPDLVAADGNGVADVFRRNLDSGDLERVSISDSGEEARAGSFAPDVSGSGRFVVFESDASNLLRGDSNGVRDVFRRDTSADSLVRISTSSNGDEANAASGAAAISADGRFVVFRSAATNLVVRDGNGFADIFLKDMVSGELIRVSVATDGTEADGPSDEPAVSDDGCFVVFSSQASNLVDNDLNGVTDIFLKNVCTDQIRRLSESVAGVEGNGGSFAPAMSANGQFVAFESLSTNLVPDDTNGRRDIFVWRRRDSVIIRISPPSERQSNGDSFLPAISADGRYVAFHSAATNLVSDDANGVTDVFAALNLLGQPGTPTGSSLP